MPAERRKSWSEIEENELRGDTLEKEKAGVNGRQNGIAQAMPDIRHHTGLRGRRKDMGDLIPSNDDIEIIDNLNARFRGAQLKKIRDHIHNRNDDMFASTRSLHRIAYRLKTWPTSGNRGKGRWYVFLKRLLSDANRAEILRRLRDSVADKKHCAGIRFWARYEPNMITDYDVEYVREDPDPQGMYWAKITLLCDHEILASENGDPRDPNPDNGERSPVHPHEVTPPIQKKRRLTADASNTKKKSAKKKTVKKKSKKPAKKKR